MTALELATRSREWLHDARLLHDAGRFESAIYLCGYAVEFALKARICRHLNWPSYRDDLPGMRSHNVTNLLSFTGITEESLDTEWNTVAKWNPESRYRGGIEATNGAAAAMIHATEIVITKLS